MPYRGNVSNHRKFPEVFQRDRSPIRLSLRRTFMSSYSIPKKSTDDARAHDSDFKSEEYDSECSEESERAEVKLSVELVCIRGSLIYANTVH